MRFAEAFFVQSTDRLPEILGGFLGKKGGYMTIQPKFIVFFAIKRQKVLAKCAKAVYNDDVIL